MKVDASELRKVYVACGVATAKKWSVDKLQAKLKRLKQLKEKEIADDNLSGLYDDIVAAVEKGNIPEVYDDEDQAAGKTAGKAGKAKVAAKASKNGKVVRQGRAGKDGKPGIIESIVEFLRTGSSSKPLTKDDLYKRLLKRFPERDNPDSMKTTVGIQVPSRLEADRGIKVRKNENGYWIEGSGGSSGKKKAKKKAAAAAE